MLSMMRGEIRPRTGEKVVDIVVHNIFFFDSLKIKLNFLLFFLWIWVLWKEECWETINFCLID